MSKTQLAPNTTSTKKATTKHTLMLCSCRGAPNTEMSKTYRSWKAAREAAQDPKVIYGLLRRIHPGLYPDLARPDDDITGQVAGMRLAAEIVADEARLYLMISDGRSVVWGWPS